MGLLLNMVSQTTIFSGRRKAGQTLKIQTENCFLWAGKAQIKKLCKSGLPYVILSWCESLNELHAATEINATHMGTQLERKNCI